MPPSKVQIPSPDREGGNKNKHFVHRFTLLTQASKLAMQSLYFPLKSEALNPKSKTISNVRNPNFRNKNTDWPTVVV